MDREFFTFSPIKARPLFKWPGGARIALWVVPNIEHYEYLPGPVRVRNPWPRMPHPDVLGYSLREYGNRVGVWRMLDVMDKHKIRCTVSLNLANFEMHPEIMHACEARGYDTLCHGIFNTSYLWEMPEDEERAYIAESGFTYSADLYHDDQPTPLKVRSGSLVTVPYTMDLNDAVLYRYDAEGE